MYQDQIILDGVPLRGVKYLEQMATSLSCRPVEEQSVHVLHWTLQLCCYR